MCPLDLLDLLPIPALAFGDTADRVHERFVNHVGHNDHPATAKAGYPQSFVLVAGVRSYVLVRVGP